MAFSKYRNERNYSLKVTPNKWLHDLILRQGMGSPPPFWCPKLTFKSDPWAPCGQVQYLARQINWDLPSAALAMAGRRQTKLYCKYLHDLILYCLAGCLAGWLTVCFYFKPPAHGTKPIYLLTAAASELFLVLICLAYFCYFLRGSNSTTRGLRSLLNSDLYSNPSLIYIGIIYVYWQCQGLWLFSWMLSFRKLDQWFIILYLVLWSPIID